MKNKHLTRRTGRVLASMLCLCLICLPLMGMSAMAGGEDSDTTVTAEPEMVVIDIVSDDEGVPATPTDLEKPEPVCICEKLCHADAPNMDCPVCSADIDGCIGESLTPEFTILIQRPSGWFTEKAAVSIRVIDVNKTAWEKVEVKIEKNGSWLDVTDSLIEIDTTTVEITENCTVYVTVTDKDGNAHTKNVYIECFDREAPSIRAGIDGALLRVEASDALSGVECIYVNGYRLTGLVNGTLDIRLKDYADEYEQMSVVAVDYAGNKSKTVQIKNPYYDDDDDVCKPTPTQQPTTPPVPTPAPTTAPTTGTVTKTPTPTSTPTPTATPAAEVTIEPGDSFTENGNAVTRDLLYDRYTNKQFIAVQTKDGDTFYIVIDYDKPIDEDGESYETYFLNLVDDADLMALLDGETVETPVVCTCTDKCVAGDVNTICPVCKSNMSECAGKEAEVEPETPIDTPEEEVKSSPAGAIAIVLVLLAIGGVAVWYFKFRKPKNTGKGKNDIDDYGFDDEDEDEPHETEPEIAEETDETGRDKE